MQRRPTKAKRANLAVGLHDNYCLLLGHGTTRSRCILVEMDPEHPAVLTSDVAVNELFDDLSGGSWRLEKQVVEVESEHVPQP